MSGITLIITPHVLNATEDEGARIIRENPERAMKIIVDAVSEYAVISRGGWHDDRIILTGVVSSGATKQDIAWGLGDGAADTWMEGDISIPKGASAELGIAGVKLRLW